MPSAVHRAAPGLIGTMRSLAVAPSVIFAGLALLGGSLWIATVPPMWGADETVHFMRAYHVSTGHLATQTLPSGGSGGYLPEEFGALLGVVSEDIPNTVNGAGRVDDLGVYRELLDRRLGPNVATDFTPSAAYSPVPYVGSAVGIALVRPFDPTLGGALWGARLGNLVLFVALVSAAIRLVSTSPLRWVMFVIGLAPLTLFQASTVNVDALSIASAAVLIAVLSRIWRHGEQLSVARAVALTASAAALAQTKPNFVFVALIAMALPSRCFPSAWLKWSMRFGFPLVVLIPFLGWNLSIGDAVSSGAQAMLGADNGIDLARQLAFVAGHPLDFVRAVVVSGLDYDWYSSAFSRVGFNQVNFPVLNTVVVSVMLVLATFGSTPDAPQAQGRGLLARSTSSAWLAGAVTAFTALSIVGTMYLTWTEVGAATIEGVQGRYFIPLVPIAAYAAGFLPVEVRMSRRVELAVYVMGAIACFALCLWWYRRATLG